MAGRRSAPQGLGAATLSASTANAPSGHAASFRGWIDSQLLPSAPDPADVAASRRTFAPEQRLVAAVIARAVADLAVVAGPDAKAAATARDWIFGEDSGGAGWSFVGACDYVGLDPDVVRRLAAEPAALPVRRDRVDSRWKVAGSARRRRRLRLTLDGRLADTPTGRAA